MSGHLDIGKLQNLHHLGNKRIARCPACAELENDKKGEHLCVYPNGSFACLVNPGKEGRAHRARIFRLVGVPGTRANLPSGTPKPTQSKTLDAVSEDVAAKLGARETRRDIYQNANGGQNFVVIRFDGAKGKSYRPFHWNGSKWLTGDPPLPLVLLNLPDLSARSEERVFVVEGEKCACELATLGVLTTTSAHGAKSAHRSDWTALEGREVVLLPDNDEEGREYALAVARILSKASPLARLKIVELPELPPKGDVSDWLEKRDAQLPEEILAELLSLADRASPFRADSSPGLCPIDVCETISMQVLPDDDATALRSRFFSIDRQALKPNEKRKFMAGELIEVLHRRGRFFYHKELRDHSSAFFFDSRRKLLQRISDPSFLSWLALFAGVNRTTSEFQYLHAALEDEALQGQTCGITPEVFWAAREGRMYLSNGDGAMVRVSVTGCEMVDNGVDDVLFAAGDTLPSWNLCAPRDPLACLLFKDANFQTQHSLDLLRVWVISLLANYRCKPPLLITGQIRSGKTLLVSGIFHLFGIRDRIRQPIESEEGKRDFWISANSGGLFCLDNADTRVRWLPDAIATASTGGGIERKKNYTDTQLTHLRARASIVITSANPTFASDSGLADRLLIVRMNSREHTVSENALLAEIADSRDAALSFIVHHLQGALSNSDPVPPCLNKRHPEFGEFAIRIGRSLGRESEVAEAIIAAERDKPLFCLENDALGSGILAILREGPFIGTAAQILDRLGTMDLGFEKDHWSAKGIGKRLNNLWPHIVDLFAAAISERQGVKCYDIRPK